MPGPLSGIRIVDLTRVLAGPFCTMILGDLGADVIKVEAPGGSDETREWGPPFAGGESAYYLCANRNKRAMTVNLKTEEGRKIIKKLINTSDVVIENFKSKTMEKWALDYETMKKANPKIIYCSITGFGHNGPYEHLPGYDFIIQALSGLMSITGSEESGPMKVGVAISDVLTGLYAVIGILAAINERNRSGEGQNIDLSLFDSQLSTLVNVASNFLISGNVPGRLGNQHPNIVPYQSFETLDGEIVIAVGNDNQFRKLCGLLNLAGLSDDPKFKTNPCRLENRTELIGILEKSLKERTTKEWIERLNEQKIPCGPIRTMKEVFEDEHVHAREMVVNVNHPKAGQIQLVGSPLKLSRTPVGMNRHPPLAGEHTDEILAELGYSEKIIQAFKEQKIV
ncbi:CaiB/BaiF CoA-transferase family protein [Fictibacillus sp. Mic-4]|uniref:CaiB/BaiF CoA transferase family protein n=1 Tax=Fictibacillus TaxID=1329200 RepID=UPI000479CE9C|nr:CaiB/BaiF CoA-transferase family protein [Fictibacillus gelatini]